jgi:hypothetical protein
MPLRTAQAAMRWAVAAFLVALVALVYSTWYLPGLTRVLNRLSKQVEVLNAGTTRRDQ